MKESKEVINEIAKKGSEQILKGLLPKNFKRSLINKGLPEEVAIKITDLAVSRANQFSHYKIGGKYCKENKNQRYDLGI